MMPVALLDVNVMMALAYPWHLHYETAHEWFARNKSFGWATCPQTQLSFLRLSLQPAVVKVPVSFSDVAGLLEGNTGDFDHQFWPLDFPVAEIRPEIRERLIGHQQLADAMLLELAIRRDGRLVTFDRRVRNLLAPESGAQSAIEVL